VVLVPGLFAPEAGWLDQGHVLEKGGGSADELLENGQQLRVVGHEVEAGIMIDEEAEFADSVLPLLGGQGRQDVLCFRFKPDAFEFRFLPHDEADEPVEGGPGLLGGEGFLDRKVAFLMVLLDCGRIDRFQSRAFLRDASDAVEQGIMHLGPLVKSQIIHEVGIGSGRFHGR
jgi:hypothetical protein